MRLPVQPLDEATFDELVRRLDTMSCNGCHQSRSVAGFHILGNDRADMSVVNALAALPPLPHVDLWLVPDLNPDGVAARTRQNADGVDLNRNFPWRWRPLGALGSTFYAGRRPLSEPESRIAYRLVRRLHPAVSIWFHQHLGLVDDSSGSRAIERRFARAAGLPLAPLAREPGSAVNWETHRFPHGSSFVVELPAGTLAAAAVARLASAVTVVSASGPR